MNLKPVLPLMALLALARTSPAQTIAPGYAVGTWQGFRPAAVTFTFDDNDPNQLAVAVPMFNEFDYDLTLFVLTNTSWRPIDWPALVAAAGQGHEIGSHTVTHPRLSELSPEQQRIEQKDAHDSIRERIPDQSALTFAYPFCVRGDVSITRAYHIAARGCQGQVERSTPADLMNISSIIVGSEGSVRTAADLNARADAAVSAKGWAVFLIHGIDDDGGWSPVASSELRAHLEYLKANEHLFWVETFGNVVRYLRQRNAVSVAELSADAREIVVQVSDTLEDNAVYNQPLTIRRILPEGWISAVVTQNGGTIEAHLVENSVEESAERYLQFDVVPDAGALVITRSAGTGIDRGESERPERYAPVEPYPNPFRASTNLVYQVGQTGPVRLEIYDLLGQKLETLVDRTQPAGRYTVSWDASRYSSGTYVFRYEAGPTQASGRLIRAE